MLLSLARAGEPGANAVIRPPVEDALKEYDIPAQPLSTALDRYAEVAHVSVGAASDLLQARMSSPVVGRYAAEDALQRLLAGTGLVAQRQDNARGASYFLAQGNGGPVAPPFSITGEPDYAGQVQARIWQALCADIRTSPGSYRLVFRFTIDAAGRLLEPHIVSSTGDDSRDAAILAVLKRLRFGKPPAGLGHEPVLMTLLPRQGPNVTICSRDGR